MENQKKYKEFSNKILSPLLKKLTHLNYRIYYNCLEKNDNHLIDTINSIYKMNFDEENQTEQTKNNYKEQIEGLDKNKQLDENKMKEEREKYKNQEKNNLEIIKEIRENFFLDITEEVIESLPEICFITEEEKEKKQKSFEQLPKYENFSNNKPQNVSHLMLTYEDEEKKDDQLFFDNTLDKAPMVDSEPEDWEDIYSVTDDESNNVKNNETIRNLFETD